MSSNEQGTPPAGADSGQKGPRSSSMTQTLPQGGRVRRKHMKRTRSAPDCKHGISSKIKIGVCAMDKKAQSKPMCEILARLTAGAEFEVVTFGDKVILEEPVDAWPLCDVLLSWHSEGFPLRKAQAYVELRQPFLINDVHSQDLLLDRRRVYKTLMEHNIPVPRHILVNREPEPDPEPDPPADIDELTTSSESAGSSPRAGSTSKNNSAAAAASAQPLALGATPRSAAAAAAATGNDSAAGGAVAASAPVPALADAAAASGDEASLPDPEGFTEEEDFVELAGVRIYKPFVEKPVSGEDHNINIYYPTSMGGGVKRLFRKVDNKSADYDPHHPGTVRRDGSYIYEEFLTTGGTDVKVYTVGPRYAHAEARKSPVVDGKVNRTADGKEVRFPVLLSPQEKEIARMVCLAFGQRVCGFDLLRSETGRSFVCDVNGWSFVKNSKKYYDDAAGILRVMILSQLAPHRLTIAPEAPMPLAGLLEEVAAASHAADGEGRGEGLHGAPSTNSDIMGSKGISFVREPSISAAAGPAELGWEEEPGSLAVDLEQDASGMKEASSLQDLTSLDGAYEEEGMGTDDSSSTVGAAANDTSRHLELRCVLAVIRHGDRTPKQKMKVTVTQAPLLELFNKYKDSKGKQAKLKSPGQLQELLDIVRALLADMEGKGSRSARTSLAAAGGPPTEEEKAQEQHEELREKLRIVRTVLEQGGTFSGINRKVQLKPTKWSNPTTTNSSSNNKQDTPEQPQQQPQGAGDQQQQQGGQGQPSKAAGVDGSKSTGASSSGGAPAAAAADIKPEVTELLLILKYGGTLTHAGRTQAEELGKTFRMIMYPRYGPAGGGGFLRLHSTYRHDLKIYSSDEGRVQMSAAAFTKGLLDLEGSSLTPILVSLVTKNASMLDAFGKGASDDILNAKNTLYQHLTWDPEKSISLCSKLALPLATPAVGVTPPVSPKSTSAEDALSPFNSSHSRGPHLDPAGSGVLPPSKAHSGQLVIGSESLPMTSSCMETLHHGRGGGSSSSRRARASGSGTGSASGELQQQGSGTPRASAASGSLVAAATANAAGHTSAGGPKLTHSASWGAVRAAEARAAALSGIKAMPDKPLALLYTLVDLMKVLVDQLREKCLEERVEAAPNNANNPPKDSSSSSKDSKQEGGSDKAAAPAGAAAGAGGEKQAAAAGGSNGQALHGSASSRGAGPYSSSATAPDDWKLDVNKPCSGERLLLMFDRWRKLLKSFYNEKKQVFDISKVPDIYDSAKYDSLHNSHLNLTSLSDLYQVSRQLAAVVVPHEYGLNGSGKLLIGSKICAELLGKLMCDLDSMKEESIITAAIEEKTAAAARAEESKHAAGSSSSRHANRPRAASHASLLDGTFDAFDTEFGHMSVLDGRMRPPKAPGPGMSAPRRTASTSASGGGGGADSQGQQQQQQQQDEQGEQEDHAEQETLHRLCPTYASDVNSPLRHVRTRIYFTSESHIHSLVNVLRYCHLACPASSNAAGVASASATAMSKPVSANNMPGTAAPAAAAASAVATTPSGSSAAAAVATQPTADGGAVASVAVAAAVGGSDGAAGATAASTAAAAAPAPAGGGGSSRTKGTVFAAASAAQAAAGAAVEPAGTDDGSEAAPLLQAVSSVASSTAGAQQLQLLTPEGQTLLDNTDEFDYLTHIVFRMYENKIAPVDSPERFFVEIQFSNGANFDPTRVPANRHTMPTQNRRLLTGSPGVPLQTFQELTGKYARGKNSPSNYQLQVALRAPLSQAANASKSSTPVPGMSRSGSGAGLASLPPLPPVPPAAATQLLVAGPGAAPSAPLPLSGSFVAAAAAAAGVGDKPAGSG